MRTRFTATVAVAGMVVMLAMVTPAAAGPAPKSKTISFCSPGAYTVTEGEADSVTINVCRSLKQKTASVTVDVYVTGTDAEVNEDFTWSGPKVVSFARNRTTASFTVPILIDGDMGAEPNEMIVFELSDPSTGYALVSGPTVRAFVTIADMQAPGTPTLEAWTSADTTISLGWTEVNPAGSTYVVSRSTDGYNWGELTSGTDFYSTDDSGLDLATTYYYEVYAVSLDGAMSLSSYASATTAFPVPPAPLITGTDNLYAATIYWAIDYSYPVEFEVFRSDSGPNASLESFYSVADQIYGSEWTDKSTTAGSVYYYRVRAVIPGDSGVQSELSEEVEVAVIGS